MQGTPLDYCSTLSPTAGCGAPAADMWCKNFGYDRAVGFTGPTPVTSGAKTTAVQSKEQCDPSTTSGGCSTFVAINCIREKLFIDPRVDGKLLDWCTEGSDKGCGREAASAFCVSQGFSHGAWSYGGPYTPSIDEDTFQPKTKRTCSGKTETCQAFSTIWCEK